ncbi:hypothetical protein CLU79DRAFT_535526 [Phycomyces nitens]|nr:hypothetical protein CLU79DRAFT_535526 [Phycomyces nitens]
MLLEHIEASSTLMNLYSTLDTKVSFMWLYNNKLLTLLLVSIIVRKTEGTFRCPLVDCQGNYSNVDTFRVHSAAKHPSCQVLSKDNSKPEKRAAKKMKAGSSQFSKEEGCWEALKLDTPNLSTLTAASLYCDPVALHVSHETLKDPITIHSLVHAQDLHRVFMRLPLASPNETVPLEISIQLHDQPNSIIPATTSDQCFVHEIDHATALMKKKVATSWIPKWLDKTGNYLEPTHEVLQALNFDYRRRPELLQAVAQLHAGCMIVDKEVVVVIAVEVYARAKSIDAHAETNQKSLPQGTSLYKSALAVGLFEEADGYGDKVKLKVGSNTMNILSTLSVPLRGVRVVDCGPSSSVAVEMIRPETARIFYRQENTEAFLAAFHDPSHMSPPINLSSLRQLTSGFDDVSTYLPWRAILEQFNSDLTMPTTVFTLCDVPSNQGYGSSALSTEKIASRFVQALAMSFLDDMETQQCFESTQKLLASIDKARGIKEKVPSKDWAALTKFASDLKRPELKSLSGQALAMVIDFGMVAKLAGSKIPDSNQKVKETVIAKLEQLYGL